MLASEAQAIALAWQDKFMQENGHLVDKALVICITKVKEASSYGRLFANVNLDDCFKSQSQPVLTHDLYYKLIGLGYCVTNNNDITFNIRWDRIQEIEVKKLSIFERLLVWMKLI